MLRYERHETIMEILNEKKSASMKELAKLLYVSEASVRRDIEQLHAKGLVRRVYGGVVLAERVGSVPVNLRDGEHGAVKSELAMRAAELVGDGDTVILDASSTVRRMVKYLVGKRDITLITNNLRILEDAASLGLAARGFKIYSTGGEFLPDEYALAGYAAGEFVRSINADAVFFSSQGMSESGEVSDYSEEQTVLRRIMLNRSKKRYFLCDSSKLGKVMPYKLCDANELTDIICDSRINFGNSASAIDKR